MIIHWFSPETRPLASKTSQDLPLPPGLQNHPIQDTFVFPDRRLTLALTSLALVLVSSGSVYISVLNQRSSDRVLQNHLQIVRLALDDGGGPWGRSSPVGGGKVQDQTQGRVDEAVRLMNAMVFCTNPPEESLAPLERRPDEPRELQALLPGELPSTIPGQGNGVGYGLGNQIGNGLGSGLGRGNGSTWIHSARGDEDLKVAVSFLDMEHYIPPEYPGEARLKRISGDVILTVTIDRHGTPVKWTIVEGEPSLVAATLDVFPRWHFIAPVYKGEKVGATFEVRIRFTLI